MNIMEIEIDRQREKLLVKIERTVMWLKLLSVVFNILSKH